MRINIYEKFANFYVFASFLASVLLRYNKSTALNSLLFLQICGSKKASIYVPNELSILIGGGGEGGKGG